jgi:hypothetical protein
MIGFGLRGLAEHAFMVMDIAFAHTILCLTTLFTL